MIVTGAPRFYSSHSLTPGGDGSVPPRGSGWVRSRMMVATNFVPTRYREVVLTRSHL